jgi:hypothetical protein
MYTLSIIFLFFQNWWALPYSGTAQWASFSCRHRSLQKKGSRSGYAEPVENSGTMFFDFMYTHCFELSLFIKYKFFG